MSFSLDRFVGEIRGSVRSAAPIEQTKALLEGLMADPDAIEAGLPTISEDETLLHVESGFTIFHIRLPPGVRYPPHEHGIIALLGLYRGRETNLFFRRTGRGLEQIGQKEYVSPTVAMLPADAIHAVCNQGEAAGAALHIYLGNLLEQERSMWHPDLVGERRYDQETYDGWAQKLQRLR
ncbi:Predicted metal-dependent enzyme of the double-stranded beta helix superfamily [Rhizobiales bacterium GAS113]|nr:Predicted metal-dependent enzyme of the double-stranded beta helix superfamily [Rhizobiales bacterium GAS113]